MDKFTSLYDLLVLVNKSRKETNDTIIAKAFIENRYDLDKLSLEQLSQKCYISQSALSRFIKKMGYKNYNEFKESMHVAMYAINNDHQVISKEKQKNIEEIRNDVHDEIIQAIENINDIDLEHLLRVIQTMNQYQNIIFLGSELSMAMTHLLQIALTNKGKNVYTIYELEYQKEILDKVDQNTLVICISLEERWFKALIQDKELFNNTFYKMLWTIEPQHIDMKLFNDVYMFGKPMNTNVGYNELMYFIMLVYRLILQEDGSFKK
ncbi:MAG: hypothetical protein LUG46_06565 [Erysipelotrichaceae bacterium]|nr:hypothetical protein [Erysipelotrichaceae bacterium]